MRLDADDVAERTRVGRLVAVLADDPQLGLVGSWCTLIDEAGRPQGDRRMPASDLEIRWTILFHSPFYHSTVAFRRAASRQPVATGRRAGLARPYLWFTCCRSAARGTSRSRSRAIG